MSYNLDTELYLCYYNYNNMEDSYIIRSKKEIQDDIRRYYKRDKYLLPSKIQRLDIQVGKEVTLKEFVPKGHQRPKQNFKAQAHNIWNEIWNS